MIAPEAESEFLRLSEAARLLGIGDTTLKRWTEDGRVLCIRTSGGHRRFRRTDILAFRSRMGDLSVTAETSVAIPSNTATSSECASHSDASSRAQPVDSRVWLDEPGEPAEPGEMAARVHELRARSHDWAETGDRVCAGLLTEIGERWASGQLTCAQEHALSREVESTFVTVSRAMPVVPGAPTMLLACVTGERHTLGLSLVETAVRERGMAVRFLGADVPTPDLVKAIHMIRPVAVGLSASRCPRPESDLIGPSSAVATACASVGARLFLGGGGNWPPVRGAVRMLTLMELVVALEPLFPHPVVR